MPWLFILFKSLFAMYHINSLASQRGGKYRLINLFFPELYRADSIAGFLRSQGDIKPTRKLWWPPVAFFGLGVVLLRSVTYNVDRKTHELSDQISSMGIHFHGRIQLSSEQREALKDGLKIFEVAVAYRPKDQMKWLIEYEIEGPLLYDGGDTERGTSFSRLEALATA